MRDNYQSAGEHFRNIASFRPEQVEVLESSGRFRIVRLAPPYMGGYEYWVINDGGFLWEPARSLEDARHYLESEEALAYQAESV